MRVLERAAQDRANGELWKARNRLASARSQYPADQKLLNELGQVLWDMQDTPAAGAVWFLTERDDEHARRARQTFVESKSGKAINLLGDLVIKAPLDAYPVAVQQRVQALIDAAEKDGYVWRKPSIPFTPERYSPSLKEMLVTVLVFAVTVGVWLVGVVSLFVLIPRL